MSDTFPTLAGTGDPAVCSHHHPDTGACSRAPAWHVLWHRDPAGTGVTSGLCETHMDGSRQYVYLDRHRSGPACGEEGYWWFDGPQGRCIVPAAGTDGCVQCAAFSEFGRQLREEWAAASPDGRPGRSVGLRRMLVQYCEHMQVHLGGPD